MGSCFGTAGKVESASMRTLYGGKDVPPATKVIWGISLWDENDIQGEWKELHLRREFILGGKVDYRRL